MPKQNGTPDSVCEESVSDLNMLARHFAGRVQYILDGAEIPAHRPRMIAVIIRDQRARAYVHSVSSSDSDTIACRATAIPEQASANSFRHEIHLIFRHGSWNIVLKRSWAIVDEEDLSCLIDT